MSGCEGLCGSWLLATQQGSSILTVIQRCTGTHSIIQRSLHQMSHTCPHVTRFWILMDSGLDQQISYEQLKLRCFLSECYIIYRTQINVDSNAPSTVNNFKCFKKVIQDPSIDVKMKELYNTNIVILVPGQYLLSNTQ